jgi:hypothetical protein
MISVLLLLGRSWMRSKCIVWGFIGVASLVFLVHMIPGVFKTSVYVCVIKYVAMSCDCNRLSSIIPFFLGAGVVVRNGQTALGNYRG